MNENEIGRHVVDAALKIHRFFFFASWRLGVILKTERPYRVSPVDRLSSVNWLVSSRMRV